MAHDLAEHEAQMGDRLLSVAVIVNVLLTVAQVTGGVISGSLSLETRAQPDSPPTQ